MEAVSEVGKTYTVEDYILAKVKFEVPVDALYPIFVDREIEAKTPMMDSDRAKVRLAYADLLKWMILGPSKVNNTSDTDNGWTHSSGGYQLSSDDIKDLKNEANAIYKELEPSSVFGRKTTFKMNSGGIKHSNMDLVGNPLPHIIR
ncbi:hypothetical protein [Prevotella histicola]|uniref:Uncharacterized protein n=1 Tax=Prevotella histicola JCM 15637 = DNF00424 TaxID=1236504 RepID=A0AAW3FC71_9BACT|nr:hypothetical protein [Prevotella histicola]KGF24855.1 hypothetical protein HMPREF2132_11200 [Prevotella histicola JCM 15637 = DNF00424]